MFLKKTVPFIVTFCMGIFTFSYFFMPHAKMQFVWTSLLDWVYIIGGGGMVVGIVSMIRTYYKRAMNKSDPNRYYSFVTLFCTVGMAFLGLTQGITSDTLFNDVFTNILVPLEATMFSLLAFYMASAAFRSFRLKSFSAVLLLITALIVMIAQIPLGEIISPYIPKVSDWILNNPNVAAQRAIKIGVSIGVVATALKIILGIDRSVFSGVGK